MLGGVVAGEIEALTEAAGPYTEGIGDVDIAAPWDAVSQGVPRRDLQDPFGGCGRCLLRSCREHEQKRHGDEYYAHRCAARVSWTECWCWDWYFLFCAICRLYKGDPSYESCQCS